MPMTHNIDCIFCNMVIACYSNSMFSYSLRSDRHAYYIRLHIIKKEMCFITAVTIGHSQNPV